MTSTRPLSVFLCALLLGCVDAEIDSDSPNGSGSGAMTADDAFGNPGVDPPPPPRVSLRRARYFAILAKSGVSTVPASEVVGNVGLSPAAATFITGFSLIVDPSNRYATSDQVTGKVVAADYAPPTPTYLTIAIQDMEAAYTDAAGRAPDHTELGAGDIGGLNLPPGVYKWSTGVLIPTDLTLTGTSSDVWIFEIAEDLTVSSGVHVDLAGGARPQNVFWQVAGAVEMGTTSHLEGIVLSKTAITMRTGASIRGKLLAQTAVNIDASRVWGPSSR